MNSTRITLASRRTRNVFGMIVVAGALLAGVPAAQAAGPGPEPGRYRNAYESAVVSTMAPREDGTYSGTTINVFRNNEGTQLCVENVAYDAANTMTSEYGCAPLADTAFTMEKKLTSATIAPTMVTLNTWDCDQAGCTVTSSRDVLVSATLEGTGELQNMKARSSFNDGTCTYQFKSAGNVRIASGTFSLDNQAQSGGGSLSKSKDLTVVRCD
jgi:hypothetical protein